MLRYLRVTNFAILSDVALEFCEGFNVLTGETGAGKSLIVEAVNLLRGGRASADIPRTGSDEATVEAVFEVPVDLRPRIEPLLAEAGLVAEGGEVLVRRVIQRGGRSRTYVNGAMTTAQRLAELGAFLVDLSGQHQHQGLVDVARHRDILDAFAQNGALAVQMHDAHAALATVELQLESLQGDEAALAERAGYLKFQVDEIEAARLIDGEDLELEQEQARLHSVDVLETAVRRADELVYAGEGSAADQVALALRDLERAAEIDASLDEPVRMLTDAHSLLGESSRALTRYADRLEADPGRLAEVDERLAELRRLQRKHGGTLADVIERGKELRKEFDAIDSREERIAELEAERKVLHARAMELAKALSKRRRSAADELTKNVNAALVELSMDGASLTVAIEDRELARSGIDHVEFLLSANKGERAKAIAKVASGGELSRIMLALKLCLRSADDVATYVFDEVDTGIGGVTATAVGRQIRRVGDSRQVLCVTHLPQIAAFGDRHIHVSKHELKGRTETAVEVLQGARRDEEMARMLGGDAVSDHARAHAREMISDASRRSPTTTFGKGSSARQSQATTASAAAASPLGVKHATTTSSAPAKPSGEAPPSARRAPTRRSDKSKPSRAAKKSADRSRASA